MGRISCSNYWSSMFKEFRSSWYSRRSDLAIRSSTRHADLSLLAHNGYSMAEIQEEQDIQIQELLKYYVHILDERDQEMADSFSAGLGINNGV